jgi:hypothetical protein
MHISRCLLGQRLVLFCPMRRLFAICRQEGGLSGGGGGAMVLDCVTLLCHLLDGNQVMAHCTLGRGACS